MKKLNIFAGLLIGLVAFTAASCDDDRDNNPVINDVPTTNAFVLNSPAYANANVDLATSDSLNFSWSQPNFGFPAAVEYQMQFSVDNVWTTSVADSIADTTGETPATYGNVGTPTGSVTTKVAASDVATVLEQIKHWPDGEVPSTLTAYARVQAVYAGDTIYSNPVSLTVLPYYVELKDADPIIYYLVGGSVADGNWTNSEAAIGTSMIPFLPVPGATFDKATGAGQIEWYGYLDASQGFKIIVYPGDWDHGICGDGSNDGGTSIRNGGDDPGNIGVAESGYYHIVVNTNADFTQSTTTITKMDDQSPAVHTSMSFLGDFNSWDLSSLMTAMNTNANNSAYNHDWVMDVTIDADGGVKFTADGAWTTNWGNGLDFPYGTGTNNGDNIPAKAGTYKVFLNDISGTYYFFSQE